MPKLLCSVNLMPKASQRTYANGKGRALKVLRERLGDCVEVDGASRYEASMDGSRLSWMPAARVRVERAEQVGSLLATANHYRVPVTTRGAGTSLTASASPSEGGWVLDLSRLKRVRIDAESQFAEVGAGAVLADIQKVAARKGLFYPPDPSSVKYCTIGGTIACNAGGLRGAKYGVTRDYVVALEGYLASGEAFAFGRALRKWAVGYNLRDLLIGSEGTLGVITSAVVRLLPKPESRATFLLAFAREEAALKAVRSILDEAPVPAALEYLDVETISGLEAATGRAVFPKAVGSPMLLVELDGAAKAVRQEARWLSRWAGEHALAWKQARSEEEAVAIWDVRRGASSAMFAHGDGKLNEDIIVPRRSQVPLVRFLRKLRKQSGLHIPTFGHAADGNFHVNIMYHRDVPEECERAETAVDALMQKVVELGGAISGEHGIGLAKTPFLRYQYGEAELKAMRAVKQALDPQGILNPGKLFEPVNVWEKQPEKVVFPWDHRKIL